MPYFIGGFYEQQRIAFRSLTIILVAAIVLIFALLFFLYESFRVAMAILLTNLPAVAAALGKERLTQAGINRMPTLLTIFGQGPTGEKKSEIIASAA